MVLAVSRSSLHGIDALIWARFTHFFFFFTDLQMKEEQALRYWNVTVKPQIFKRNSSFQKDRFLPRQQQK